MKIIISCIAICCIAATVSFAKSKAKNPAKTKNPVAVIKTSMGTFECELYKDDAPKTVANFVGLSKKGFYNGILFHRVIKGFVIQAGDPLTKDKSQMARWGTGGESIYGKEFEDELNPNTPSYKAGYVKGVLAMANRGPNTNTSQFFVMCGQTLPHQYTIFGKVIKGIDVVDKIDNVPTVPGDRPKVDVVIEKITIE
ncbi:MAG TPA: peptidylprolyl isomerase [Candidatus Kapabacteria bacterium]|nr:peptidylprolyl isomerase [Candidatus Kapabacteria bacterium]